LAQLRTDAGPHCCARPDACDREAKIAALDQALLNAIASRAANRAEREHCYAPIDDLGPARVHIARITTHSRFAKRLLARFLYSPSVIL
jgi:hypothetical protein